MMKNFYKIFVTIYLAFGAFATSVFANPPRLEGIFPVIYNALTFVFSFFAIITAGMVVYGAYMWMASAGDPQKTKQAQGVLTWAVIGLIFFITFGFFADFFFDLLGIEFTPPDQEVFDF